ncbi:MAG TPA: PilZ domain-containing protein [Myxococcota bacterium]|nr:PilZ domain-containing protein [Myxococcota bacterium]
MPAKTPPLLVLDDGELDDVVELLNELGVEHGHLRGAAIPAQIAPPDRVIVTTPRRAMLTKDWPRSAPYRIAVVTEDSNTLRAMLRRVGFDLLLRRPVHPYALRLVLLRGLYAGEEKRREERVAVGIEIQFRSGFRRKRALIADLSQRGCRILGEKPLALGTRIHLPLPPELSPSALVLPCKVVRASAKPESDGRFEMGLAYENLSREKLIEVRALLKRLSDAAGMEDARVLAMKAPARAPAPAPTPLAARTPDASARPPVAARPAPAPAFASAPKNPPSAPEKPVPMADRRQHPRASYSGKVPRLDDEADSVLLGRDLSVGGMRVEYHPNLQIGDVLELAVYGLPREEPIVVKARVAQDSGDGLGLAFDNVEPVVQARLERLVTRLPSVESLQSGEVGGLGSVVSRVLSGFRRET